jgi:hypothetical protein
MSVGQFHDILQKLPSTQPVYVESATSLDDVKNRLKDLRLMFPDDYFILDCENWRGHIQDENQYADARFRE